MRKTKIIVLTLILLLAISNLATASNNYNSLFFKGNDFYQQGQYQKAITSYQKILEKGYANGQLYYNLANAYYRQGEEGLALVNYLRARRYIPSDPDLRSNLDYLMQNTQLDQTSDDWYRGFIYWLTGKITSRGLAWLSSILLTIIVILVLLRLYILKEISLQLPLAGLLLLFIISSLLTGIVVHRMHGNEIAIVVQKEAISRFEPSEQGEAHYHLPIGAAVEIKEVNDGWAQIRRDDGKRGWIKKDLIEKLNH